MRSRPPSPLPQKPGRPVGSTSTRRGSGAPRRSSAGQEADTSGGKQGPRRGGLNLSVKVLGLIAIVTMLAVNLVPIGLQWVQQEQEYRAIIAQVEETRAYNEELEAALAGWEDPDYIASQAKSRLGFVWPGETQYTVKDLPQSEVEEQPKTPQRGVAKPWAAQVMESMVDADSIPASEALSDFTPTEDPNEERLQDE